jgi:hypothetical protein
MHRAILIALILFSTFATDALARDVYVNGYTRSDGTYVRPLNENVIDTTTPSGKLSRRHQCRERHARRSHSTCVRLAASSEITEILFCAAEAVF